MKTHRSSIAPFLFVLTGTVSLLTGEAPAALILTINEATANRLSFTLGGTFDATVIGSDPFYLAIKPDWSTHIGTNVPWLADSLGLNAFAFVPGVTITENTAIGAMLILNKSVEAIPDYRLGDSIFYGTSDTIPAGTAVSGTLTMEGTNIYDYSGLTALQLVSGNNNGTQD